MGWVLFAVALVAVVAVVQLARHLARTGHDRYEPRHVLPDPAEMHAAMTAERPLFGSMDLAEERKWADATGWLRGLDGVLASTTTSLPPDPDQLYDPADDEPFRWVGTFPADPVPHAVLASDERIERGEPSEAEVAAARAAHGYIPELDPDTITDLGGSAGELWQGPLGAPVQPDSGPGPGLSSLDPGPDPLPGWPSLETSPDWAGPVHWQGDTERLAHTWDRLPAVVDEPAIEAWAGRLRAEVAGWHSEPWAVRFPWEAVGA